MKCPCHSNETFENCCSPFLSGKKRADTAEKLMRSRYTAYTKADIEYIKNTMVPEKRKKFDAIEAKQWATSSKWKKLENIDTEMGGPDDKTGMVEFVATYEKEGEGVDHHEVSMFRKGKDGEWLFVDGEAHEHKEGEGHHEASKPVVRQSSKVGRNDPCHCGSGKKFKKCCETAAIS
jgi:SEC-C motif-containing protein